ncbi:hypothetical protein FH972_021798 [Carpinus fangiana]|uniref:Uncharacterized protein n=1 Tax=Carpinus fangiana TaxID=176857 RepID=A0A5N6KR09_9ROSI|nr:hypothetical protein FH972_021798 [Carpinus fangiana]
MMIIVKRMNEDRFCTTWLDLLESMRPERSYQPWIERFPPHTTPDQMERAAHVDSCTESGYYNSWVFAICPHCVIIGMPAPHSEMLITTIDGGCRANGSTRPRASIGVFFDSENLSNFQELLPSDLEPTNQKPKFGRQSEPWSLSRASKTQSHMTTISMMRPHSSSRPIHIIW